MGFQFAETLLRFFITIASVANIPTDGSSRSPIPRRSWSTILGIARMARSIRWRSLGSRMPNTAVRKSPAFVLVS